MVASQSKTIDYDQLEDWQKDNEYIHSGYRKLTNSYTGVAWSVVGYIHNETVNIWTHLIGTIVAASVFYLSSHHPLTTSNPIVSTYFSQNWLENTSRKGLYAPLYIVFPFASDVFPTVTIHDRLGFACFLLSAVVCLLCSSLYHSCTCHSQVVAKKFNKLDYVGIVVLIVGSFQPALYYGFFCNPLVKRTYMISIMLLGLAAVYAVLSPTYSSPKYRKGRTAIFIALGLSGVVPVIHAILLYGYNGASNHLSLPWLLSSGAMYIIGALFYADRIPERFIPGGFDIIGASHQIFHCFILLAALAHYCALGEAFRYWHGELDAVCHAPNAAVTSAHLAGDL